eukprot:c11637_g1_i1.p1 GENE.c11637_g1_i1~~c11637_g1_i1.p1  ORF type:complete len:657 (+),score=145.33 c11637_g1_i1:32-2002(+)
MKRKRDFLNDVLASSATLITNAAAGSRIMNERQARPIGASASRASDSVEFDDNIRSFLSEVLPRARLRAQELGGGAIEVEVRLGQLCIKSHRGLMRLKTGNSDAAVVPYNSQELSGSVFSPGTSPQDFEKFQNMFSSLSDVKTVSTTETVHSYEGNFRVISDLNSPSTRLGQTKQKIEHRDFFLPHCPYDIRLEVAVETPLTPVGDLQSEPKNIRTRERRCFTGPGLFGLSVDTTFVKNASAENERAYEIELEIPQNFFANVTDESSLVQCAAKFSALLSRGVMLLIPNVSEATQIEIEPGHLRSIKDTCRSMSGHRSDAFPGTMPVGLARRHLETVRRGEYFVSEKTDGVRYFMVRVHGYPTVMIDRKFHVFTVSGLSLLSANVPEGTVLDGELVMNRKERRPYFIVFDLISIGGQTVAHEPLFSRFSRITEFVGMTFDQHRQSSSTFAIGALPLVRKVWYPLPQLRDLFKCIQQVDESVYLYNPRDNKRYHHTDGIIFAPNTPYVCGTNQHYYKWKWANQVTIDFLVKVEGDAIVLFVQGPNEILDMTPQIGLHPMTRERILAEAHTRGGMPVVWELGFEKQTGYWKAKCLRSDKDKGNFILTAVDALMQLAENLEQNDLIKIFSPDKGAPLDARQAVHPSSASGGVVKPSPFA